MVFHVNSLPQSEQTSPRHEVVPRSIQIPFRQILRSTKLPRRCGGLGAGDDDLGAMFKSGFSDTEANRGRPTEMSTRDLERLERHVLLLLSSLGAIAAKRRRMGTERETFGASPGCVGAADMIYPWEQTGKSECHEMFKGIVERIERCRHHTYSRMLGSQVLLRKCNC